ncbi:MULTISPECIES: HalOD1 output domain-containing protein [Natrialbaceae]|uniref:HalOD1 output domain-containing protein n=1 Tax=Natrialbaceae TaxID=1644061 RepID=UPI0031F31481
MSTTVIETIAARDGVDPVELEHPLYEATDPDALDALFAPPRTGMARSDGRLQFSYCGYDVIVRSDGDVTVTDPAEPAA